MFVWGFIVGIRKVERRVWSFCGTCPEDGEDRESGKTRTLDKKKERNKGGQREKRRPWDRKKKGDK